MKLMINVIFIWNKKNLLLLQRKNMQNIVKMTLVRRLRLLPTLCRQ